MDNTTVPPQVLKYLELSEIEVQMKKSYSEQCRDLKSEIKKIKPSVEEWLLKNPNRQMSINTHTEEEKHTWGISGKLSLREQNVPKNLTQSHIYNLCLEFFSLSKVFPEKDEEDVKNITSLLTDYIWLHRETKTKVDLRRTYTNKKRKTIHISDDINV
jgi:hypothetical protein